MTQILSLPNLKTYFKDVSGDHFFCQLLNHSQDPDRKQIVHSNGPIKKHLLKKPIYKGVNFDKRNLKEEGKHLVITSC